jgi:outer membrane protein OmpA-like peptidoglycan-associated protein
MSRTLAPALVLLLLLQACAATAPRPGIDAPVTAAPATTAPAGAPAVPRASALTAERQWLQSWFDGTPVLIVQPNGASVSIDVPREFSFDSGRSKVKPPLAAVLDKVAQSLMRTPAARLELVAAPGDDATPSPLAQQRANQVRSHLLSRGVPAAQLGKATPASTAAVQLRMDLVAP